MKLPGDNSIALEAIVEKPLNKSDIDAIVVERNTDKGCDLVVGLFVVALRGN